MDVCEFHPLSLSSTTGGHIHAHPNALCGGAIAKHPDDNGDDDDDDENEFHSCVMLFISYFFDKQCGFI